MKKKVTFFFLLFLFISTLFSLNNLKRIGHLEIRLNKCSDADTSRVDIMNEQVELLLKRDLKKVKEKLDKAIELSDKLNYMRGKAVSLRLMGMWHLDNGKYEKASSITEESIALGKISGAIYNWGKCLLNLGIIKFAETDYGRAMNFFVEAERQVETTGDKESLAHVFYNKGLILLTYGDFIESQKYFHKALSLFTAEKNNSGVAQSLIGMSGYYFHKNDLETALTHCIKARDIYKEDENLKDYAIALNSYIV